MGVRIEMPKADHRPALQSAKDYAIKKGLMFIVGYGDYRVEYIEADNFDVEKMAKNFGTNWRGFHLVNAEEFKQAHAEHEAARKKLNDLGKIGLLFRQTDTGHAEILRETDESYSNPRLGEVHFINDWQD
jgi:hypothetical protein